MAGETNLENLLHSLSPELVDGEFVFCTIQGSSYGDYANASAIASFTETEGLTLVLPRDAAEKVGLGYETVFRCISLGVHSSLKATGLTAAVSGKLSEHGIVANVIAAYFHDHVFVPADSAQRAIDLLSSLNG